MAGLWQKDDTGWHLLAPTGFPEERTLHDLVEDTPGILPLAGDPRLVVIGKEVSLGNGYADLLAIEPSGRLAIIELVAMLLKNLSPGDSLAGTRTTVRQPS